MLRQQLEQLQPPDPFVGGRAPSYDTPRLLNLLTGVRWQALVLPTAAFVFVTLYFAVRAVQQVVPEGDAALHLHLMETVARGHFLKTVPYFAAIVDTGGDIAASFPYSYTPLYHLVGGLVFKLGGEEAALMIGPVCAGLIAVGLTFLLRPYHWAVVALALALVFFQWLTQPVMTWIFMEPMMLAFFIGGLAFYQRAWANRSRRDAVFAGVFFGLAVATRQLALLYVAFVAMHAAVTLLSDARHGFDSERFKLTASLYVRMAVPAALTSLPFLGYLAWSTGTIGYGEFSVPGIGPTLVVDPVANDYLSAISTPDASPIEWLNGFWSSTLYVTRWQMKPITYVPIVLFGIGILYLVGRGDRPSRFLASYIPLHIVGEMIMYMTIHGNWRYIIASRVLFYLVVAMGIAWLVSWAFREANTRLRLHAPLVGLGASCLVLAALAPAFVTPGLIDYLRHQEEGRAQKGRSFQELGEFVQERVPEDALILSGRWYSTGWYLRRNYAWVTYFGNAWVIDAISNPNAAAVRRMLKERGIDYVVVQSPPPSYVDQMPRYGLRQIVLDDLDHFQLVFDNERTRLYRFWPYGISR